MTETPGRAWIITKYVARGITLWFWRLFDGVWDFIAHEWATLAGEGRLYLGGALLIIGLMNVEPGRFCDGNTADYFACTHPVTYYDYPWWSIAFVVVGTLLLLGWWRHKDRS